ncbi:MAG: hypothetical protein QNJ69_04580 [Gammaproteobacteria bacterium]|nr:hypothetical protein [Gammaproteobacteria bacterium]
MSLSKKSIISFLALLFIVFSTPAPAASWKNFWRVSVSEIHTTYVAGDEVILTITGKNFLRRNNRPPYISLGQGLDHELLSASDTELQVKTDLADGDYLVRISKSRWFGILSTDSYDLTIGASGKQGVDGVAGEPGVDGIDGPLGPVGEMGPVGPQGIAGAPGVQGIKGEVGPRGITGPAGAPGAAGLRGDPGPAGEPGAQGQPGMMVQHYWQGTQLSFSNPDYTWGEAVDLKGDPSSGFDYAQSCAMFASVYQNYSDQPELIQTIYQDSFDQINQLCLDTCPADFRQEIEDLRALVESQQSPPQQPLQLRTTQSGSTAIEYLIQNAIISIIAAIEIPSYCVVCGLNSVSVDDQIKCIKADRKIQQSLKSLRISAIAYQAEEDTFQTLAEMKTDYPDLFFEDEYEYTMDHPNGIATSFRLIATSIEPGILGKGAGDSSYEINEITSDPIELASCTENTGPE